MSKVDSMFREAARGRIQRLEAIREQREQEWDFLDPTSPADRTQLGDALKKSHEEVGVSKVRKPPITPKKQKKRSASIDRWGRAGTRFTQVPNLLLESKRRLEISDAELVVLLYLLKHWWHSSEERLPFPSTKKIAKAMGKNVRQIQRILHSLENNDAPVKNGWSDEKGYLKRLDRYSQIGRQQSNQFDLSKLKNALEAIALEIEQAEEQVHERKPNPPKATRKGSVSHEALKRKGYT